MRWEFLILVSNQNKLAFEVIPKYQISWIRIMQGAYFSFLFYLTFSQYKTSSKNLLRHSGWNLICFTFIGRKKLTDCKTSFNITSESISCLTVFSCLRNTLQSRVMFSPSPSSTQVLLSSSKSAEKTPCLDWPSTESSQESVLLLEERLPASRGE